MIVVIQLMVLFDVIHVVNTKSPDNPDKSFLYTGLEVFCLGKFKMKMENLQVLVDAPHANWIELQVH